MTGVKTSLKTHAQNRIAVIQCQTTVAKIIQEILWLEGYTVKTTTQSLRAFDLVCDFQPDLVILDWLMPYLLGDDIVRLLRMNPVTASVPILLTPGWLFESLAVQFAHEQGGIRCLVRPVDYDELIEVVEAILRG